MNQVDPELLPKANNRLRGGYGAQAITLSQAKSTLFVGCKDGSITAIDLERAVREEEGAERRLRVPVPGKVRAGVRAIYDWGADWLLVGEDQCSLKLVGWKEKNWGLERDFHRFDLPSSSQETSPVTLIDEWGAGPAPRVIVSLRQGDTWTFRPEAGDSEEKPFRPAELRSFPGVRAICGVVRDGSSQLLISESGELWLVDEDGDAVKPVDAGLPDPWVGLERPGLISDVAPMSFRHGSRGAGAYFSCDEGVFRLRFVREMNILKIEKELLPGLSGMSMAVSQTVRDERAFLWVADLVGDVSLFWRPTTAPEEQPLPWRRLGFRLESSQVIRSMATCLPLAGKEALVVGQACRSDRIVVTWYPLEPSAAEAEGSAFDLARLLSSGTWEELRRRVEATDAIRRAKREREQPEWAGPIREEWTPEAVLADLFEEAGEHPGELAYFLANPTTDLAWSVLRRIAPEGQDGRAAQAVLTWTYALIGTIHRRMRTRREQQCLGVIRWLRRLSEGCSAAEPWHAEVAEACEQAIQHARKWGVFGNTYCERQEIEMPLEALGQSPSDYRRFDHIVHSALLFGRRVNREAEFPDKPRGPLTAWDVRYLALPLAQGGRRELVAVSWRERIELYQRLPAQGGPAKWRQVWPPDHGKQEVSAPEPESGEGFSRKILMGLAPRNGDMRPYILEAPARIGTPESFRLWWIDPSPEGGVEAAETTSRPPQLLGEHESVFSFLELAPGLVLAGLQVGSDQNDRSRREKLPLVVVKTTAAGGFELLRCSDENAQLPSVYPETRTIESERNPVLALARDPQEKSVAGRYTVVVGRGDGQILRITLRVPENGTSFDLDEEKVRVGRLGSPVRALAYQGSRSDSTGDRPPRVFAGGADGTLVAFQEVGVHTAGSKPKETGFATLWATREEGPIARLHVPERALPESGGMSLVLAVTQMGMAILFLNCSRVEDLKKGWEEHQRIRVPGERLGRFRLGANVFGSSLIEQAGEHHGRVARLVVATGEGTLRVLSLHYPKYTDSRKAMFSEIQRAWLSTLRDSKKRVRVSLLRKIESMHVAAPHLPSVFVRWILPSKPTAKSWKQRVVEELGTDWPGKPVNQWIPRHLQALVELDEEWSAGNSLKGRVRAALLDAWKVGDLLLFKEMIQVILRRANEDLFDQARRGGQDPRFAEQFREIMQDLNEMKGVWLGGSGDTDTKIRIIFAKSLVDGDTLWSLASMLGKEGDLLRESDPPIRPVQDGSFLPDFTHFRRAMRARVEQLHRFLAAGDPLLALETLRAANLAILRSCRRLLDERSYSRDLHWDSIQGYFEAVGDFAARVAHSGRGDLTEAVAHEICRAYAVGMLACPPRAFRLSSWMCEADLPHELASGVRLQLQLLEQLLDTRLPAKPRALFDSLIAKLLDSENASGTLLSPKQRAWGDEERPGDGGQDNRDLVRETAPFDELLEWLRSMADHLSREASDIGLHETWERLEKLKVSAGDREQVIHSRKFWTGALQALLNALEEKGFRKGEQRTGRGIDARLLPARPQLVLFSRSLKSWCDSQREVLRQLKDEYAIFDPQYSMYVRALDQLGAAAAGFPQSAALQKNMVLGVLGHSLLELLDEHLLELWEIAQVLDPQQTWDQEDRIGNPPEPGSRAAEFANHLLFTAQRAELIPKNLRSLQGLLSYHSRESKDRPYTLGQLFRGFQVAWEGKDAMRDRELRSRTYHFLDLTLRELLHNHEIHGLSEEPPRVIILSDAPPRFWIEFSYDDKVHLTRLIDVRRESDNLQRPVQPLEEPNSKSHGAGLYLANLAAATEGWTLKIKDPKKSPGCLRFVLSEEEP